MRTPRGWDGKRGKKGGGYSRCSENFHGQECPPLFGGDRRTQAPYFAVVVLLVEALGLKAQLLPRLSTKRMICNPARI